MAKKETWSDNPKYRRQESKPLLHLIKCKANSLSVVNICSKSRKASKTWKHSPLFLLNCLICRFYFNLKTIGWTPWFGFVKNEAYFTMTKCTTFKETRLLFQEWQCRKKKMQRDFYYDNLQMSTLVVEG